LQEISLHLETGIYRYQVLTPRR